MASLSRLSMMVTELAGDSVMARSKRSIVRDKGHGLNAR
jgi:hypothetical protein